MYELGVFGQGSPYAGCRAYFDDETFHIERCGQVDPGILLRLTDEGRFDWASDEAREWLAARAEHERQHGAQGSQQPGDVTEPDKRDADGEAGQEQPDTVVAAGQERPGSVSSPPKKNHRPLAAVVAAIVAAVSLSVALGAWAMWPRPEPDDPGSNSIETTITRQQQERAEQIRQLRLRLKYRNLNGGKSGTPIEDPTPNEDPDPPLKLPRLPDLPGRNDFAQRAARVQVGMSVAEANAIMGTNGVYSTNTGLQGYRYITWSDGDGNTFQATVDLDDGVISAIPGQGEPARVDDTFTQEMFDRVRLGMTYSEVCRIMGAEGERGTSGFGMVYYAWSNKNGQSFTIGFQDGRVYSKGNSGN